MVAIGRMSSEQKGSKRDWRKITPMTLSNLLSWQLDIPISLPLSHVDFFRVQTCLSTSQLNQILVKLPFILTCGLIFFVILITLGGLLEGLSCEDSSKGRLYRGRTNHSASGRICLSIHCKARWMIYMCTAIICGWLKGGLRAVMSCRYWKLRENFESHLSQSQIIKMKAVR